MEKIKVKIKKLHPDAKMPEKVKDQQDFCYDMYACTDAMPVYDDNGDLIPNVWRYDTGIAYEIVRDDVNVFEEVFDYGLGEVKKEHNFDLAHSSIILDIDGRARSSIYKTGLSLSNCVATLDETYRNGVSAIFYDIVPSLPKYKKGERIIQVKLGFTYPIEWEWVDEINEDTKRGLGGFGSSGLN